MPRTIEIMLPLALMLSLLAPSYAADISVTGDWSRTIGTGDLQAGAGSDLVSAYQSDADAVLLTVWNTGGGAWRVDVRRADTTWDTDLTLSVRRTGDGTGGGTIGAGTTYQAIAETNAEFFSGSGDRSNVALQFNLTGMSLQVPPDTYVTTITYTVVDI